MSNAKTIRENAKEELGRWFAGTIKREISEVYKFARKEGLRAVDAIEFARMIVQDEVNKFMIHNFYGRSPF